MDWTTIFSTVSGIFSTAQAAIIILCAVLVLVVCAWLAGDYHGHSVTNAAWQAKYAAAQVEAKKSQDAMQAAQDTALARYEVEKAAHDTDNAKYQQEISHALIANAAFSSCHAGASFMRAYNQLAGEAPSN